MESVGIEKCQEKFNKSGVSYKEKYEHSINIAKEP